MDILWQKTDDFTSVIPSTGTENFTAEEAGCAAHKHISGKLIGRKTCSWKVLIVMQSLFTSLKEIHKPQTPASVDTTYRPTKAFTTATASLELCHSSIRDNIRKMDCVSVAQCHLFTWKYTMHSFGNQRPWSKSRKTKKSKLVLSNKKLIIGFLLAVSHNPQD